MTLLCGLNIPRKMKNSSTRERGKNPTVHALCRKASIAHHMLPQAGFVCGGVGLLCWAYG